MYVIRNEGRFPVVVRDLNYHVEGGKSIDLDLVFRREKSEASVDLKNLIRCKKVIVLNKDQYTSQKQNIVRDREQPHPQTSEKPDLDSLVLTELLKEIRGMKDMFEQGVNVNSTNVNQSVKKYDDATNAKIAELQARTLSQGNNEVEKNFENIGNVTENKDSNVSDMLDILDSLGNE
jgi:hypothetical protein